MILTNIAVDEHGHSYFNEVDIPMTGTPQRIQTKNGEVLYWEVATSQPGHFIDFTPSGEAKFLAVFSGQMDIIVSNGDIRHFARGDMLTVSDLKGQGHIKRFTGIEACNWLTIAVPGNGFA